MSVAPENKFAAVAVMGNNLAAPVAMEKDRRESGC
jgi:hypothetical protein